MAELEGHTALVTSIVVVPIADSNARKFMCYCWTSSLDGTIRKWDFLASELLKTIDVKLPVFSMVLPHISTIQSDNSEKSSKIYAIISVEDNNKPADQSLRCQIQIYNLSNATRVKGLLAETRKPAVISVDSSGKYIGIRNKQKLNIWNIPSYKEFKFSAIKKIKLHHTKKFSVLAFHPSERIVAGGDVTGRILIWRGVGKRKFSDNLRSLNNKDEDGPGVRENDDADSCTTWHWHPSEVQILFFSSDGAYLYSGGKEGVLVVWQLDTGKKKFKPRLGSPLLYYTHSPDPSLSCVSCADNQIHLLKMPSMEIIKTIAGIKLPFSLPNKCKRLQSCFAFENNAGLVALPTSDYCIQFFNLFENAEVSQVQVCERNFQPVDDLTIYVALTSLSIDGSMMGTVDVRLPEEGLGGRVTLKFWMRGSRDGNYELVTVIYEPHSDAQISTIAFRPGHAMAVSTSVDGEFKLWIHHYDNQLKDQAHKKSGWRCQSVGSYKKIPMTAAAFSADGSVLAVAAETSITLWDPDTNSLVAVIGDTLSPMTTLCFTGNAKYIVTSSQDSNPQLAVWDLSNLSIFWSYKLCAEAIACTEDGSQFAVLALTSNAADPTVQDGVILLFDVQNPVCRSTWMVKKAKGGRLAFLSSDTSREHTMIDIDGSLLVYINSDHEYIIFDPNNSNENQISRSAHKIHVPDDEQEQVGYASIYGELPDYKKEKEEAQVLEIPYVPSKSPWDAVCSGSSLVLPPLMELCSNFLESLLESKPIMMEQ